MLILYLAITEIIILNVPNGQGIVALMILNILQEFDVSSLGPDSFERIT